MMDTTMNDLSPDERRLIPEAEQEEAPSVRALRLRLEDELYEARKMAEWFHAKIAYAAQHRALLSMDWVEQYATWKAREALTIDKLERMGLRK
jgi:hypothetical protein